MKQQRTTNLKLLVGKGQNTNSRIIPKRLTTKGAKRLTVNNYIKAKILTAP